MKRWLLVIVLYIFIICILTFPAIFHLSDKVIGDGGDNYQFMGFQYLVYHQIVQGEYPLGWTNYWRYPVGFNLTSGSDGLLFMFIGVFLYSIHIFSPPQVYNLSVLIVLLLNCLCSYIVLKKLFSDTVLGFIGGLIYGLSFYVLSRAGGYTNLLFVGWFPLFVYSIILVYERKGRKKSLMFMFGSIILTFLSSLQYVLILAGSMPFIISFSFIFFRKKTIEYIHILMKYKWRILVGIIGVSALFLSIHYDRLENVFSGKVHDRAYIPKGQYIAVPTINFFVPNTYHKLLFSFYNSTAESIEYAYYLGRFEVYFFIAYLLITKNKIREKLFLLLLSVLFILFTFERYKIPISYASIVNYYPFLGIAEPGRFYVIWYFFIVFGVLSFLSDARKRVGLLVLMMVFALFLLERLPNKFYLVDTLYDKNFIESVSATSTVAVLDVPMSNNGPGYLDNLYDAYSIYYKKPIVGGYIHWTENSEETSSFLNKFGIFLLCAGDSNEKIIPLLRTNSIHTIVVHKDIIQRNSKLVCVYEVLEDFFAHPVIDENLLFENENKKVYQIDFAI